jgi:hypothetical protein
MSNQELIKEPVSLEQVLILAQRLRPVDQARLVARLAPQMEGFLTQIEPDVTGKQITLRGLLTDLGPAPSADEIDEAQHEMWASFAQD